MTSDRKVAPPPKEELAYSMEALIHHFKLWTEGFKAPEGEVYASVESPRGEFSCISIATVRPSRAASTFARRRSPIFLRCPS